MAAETAPSETWYGSFDNLPLIAANATKYEVLGLGPDAAQQDIRRAFRRQAMLYHPDRHAEQDRKRAEEVFKRITVAYRTLSEEQERRRYDEALRRHEEFREGRGDDEPSVPLSDILAGIDAYEHAFAGAGKLDEVDARLRELVQQNLVARLSERIVGVWPMRSTPAGFSHPGSFKKGAVVLTNLRVMLPFTYGWEEVKGNTRYRYSGAGMPAFVLPLIEKFSIAVEGKLKKKLWLGIHTRGDVTRFRPGRGNLSKLLLIAWLWKIPLVTQQEPAPKEDFFWALFGPWKWAAGLSLAAIVGAALLGVFEGGFIENPLRLIQFFVKEGIWQWIVVSASAVSACRLWWWILAYRRKDVLSAFITNTSAAQTAPVGVASIGSRGI